MASGCYRGESLFVLGAGDDQAAVIRKSRNLGLTVHAFDKDPRAQSRNLPHFFHNISTTDVDRILSVARKIEPKGILTVASDASVPSVNAVANALGLAGNPVESSAPSANKGLLYDAAASVGIGTPTHAFVSEVAGAERALGHAGIEYPFIVKPVDRSGSRGVRVCQGPQSLSAAVATALTSSRSGVAIIQEFLEGRQFDVQTLSQSGHHSVVGVIEEFYTFESEYPVAHSFVCPPLDAPRAVERVTSRVPALLDKIGIRNGACHIEFRMGSEDDLRIIDFGARMGGNNWSDIVQLATDFDYLRGLLDVTLGEALMFEQRQPLRRVILSYSPSNLAGSDAMSGLQTSSMPCAYLGSGCYRGSATEASKKSRTSNPVMLISPLP